MAKKLVDQSKLCEPQKSMVEELKRFGKRRGTHNTPIDEPRPTYVPAGCEKIIPGENNNFIIMGRDRPGTAVTGFGGRGGTQCSRIDLIAGMASSYRHKDGTYGPPCHEVIVNPHFATDGARVYISQRSNIDRHMGLAPSNHLGEARSGASAIGLKADAVRIHARQDIKIVTGRGRFQNLGEDGERLADGSVIGPVGTISFIAGNYLEDEEVGSLNMLKRSVRKGITKRKLQPLVKGDNLEECLRDIFSLITELASLMDQHDMAIDQINASTTGHIHNVALPVPIPTIPSVSYAPVGAVVGSSQIPHKGAKGAFKKRVDSIMLNYLGNKGRDNRGSKEMTAKHIFSKYVFTT
jgi:hypothetical protein